MRWERDSWFIWAWLSSNCRNIDLPIIVMNPLKAFLCPLESGQLQSSRKITTFIGVLNWKRHLKVQELHWWYHLEICTDQSTPYRAMTIFFEDFSIISSGCYLSYLFSILPKVHFFTSFSWLRLHPFASSQRFDWSNSWPTINYIPVRYQWHLLGKRKRYIFRFQGYLSLFSLFVCSQVCERKVIITFISAWITAMDIRWCLEMYDINETGTGHYYYRRHHTHGHH